MAHRSSIAIVIAAFLTGCGSPPAAEPTEPQPSATSAAESGSPTPGASDDGPDCKRFGYPCSLAETPDELIERTTDLLGEARQRREEGTMSDALAHLREQSDVVEAFGSDDAIVFRVEGAAEAWFVDGSRDGDERRDPTTSRMRLASAIDPPPTAVDRTASVVGEDTTGDGAKDNRDTKRALVLAPYHWQFAPYDESDLIAANLATLPGYAGAVTFVANRAERDQNVALDHFRSFADYDTILLSTHGNRLCGPSSESAQLCRVVINTGVRINRSDTEISGRDPGLVFYLYYPAGEPQSTGLLTLGMNPDFFRLNYPGGLDNTLLILSACETGNNEGHELAAAAAGSNFVMMAWSEKVPASAAFQASTFFAERLGLGLSSGEAYRDLVDAGLHRATDKDGVNTVFQHISPGNADVRIFEVPTILMDGAPMQDGADASAMVIGTAGDGAEDRLLVTLQVSGVDDPIFYSVRYEIDGRPTRGEYDLLDGGPGGYEHEYVVDHDVDVGFDLPSDKFTIEAIVELPEGGESRYFVTSRLCPTTENGVPVPFDLPSDATYAGKFEYLPRADAWRVGSLQAAAEFMRGAIDRAGYTIIDEPRGSTLGGENESFGFTVVGPCFPSGGSVTFTRSATIPPSLVLWSAGGN